MTADLQPHEKRGPIAWMAGHSVTANLIMLFCLVSAGRRADEGEERILRLISDVSHDDIKKNITAQTSEIVIVG